jgi:Flp pilus assembly protein TadG
MSRLLAFGGIFDGLAACHPALRRLLRETRSDTAVEFAMIGAAFFLLIFGIFVVSIDQFWQMTLDDAVRAATRKIQVGQLTATSTPSFVTVVCDEFGVAAPYCASTLQYSVQGGTSFAGMSPATLNANGTLSGPYVVVGSAAPSFNGVVLTTAPAAATSTSAAVVGVPQFLLVQVAYPLPFKVLAVPGGVATENGTPSLYSAAATVMEP